jgi:hypothetical protein
MTGPHQTVARLSHSRRRPSRWPLPGVPPAHAEPRVGPGQPFTCPVCGGRVTNHEDAQYGYCRNCGEGGSAGRPCVADGFTGMCAAGRFVMSPQQVLFSFWQIPCTIFGTEPWLIIVAGASQWVLLCPGHGAQIRHDQAPLVDGGPGPMGEQLAFPRQSLIWPNPACVKDQGR